MRFRRRSLRAATALALVGAMALTACGSTKSATSSGSGSGGYKVGFIMVGSRHDYGYNQAVFDASQKVAKGMPGVTVVTADNIPENNSVTQTMQTMANSGVKVIFASSYGYFSYAEAFAKANPGVIVLHQGGFEKGTFPPNFGTYWGQAFEPVSLGGMAAGATTKSNKLGFVYAFPISQTIANIDAFQIGAASLNPDAKTYLVNTSNWCDPLKQKEAASALLSQGVDVLTQHQDCQATVIGAAKAANAKVVGYHFDAESLYPAGWLTGSVWNWAPLYEKIITAAKGGTFKGGTYNANYVGSFANHDNPLVLAPFGSSVDSATRTKITAEQTKLEQPGSSVFTGPLFCQDGSVLVAAGKTMTYDEINNIKCLVKGVVGTLPKS